MKYQHQSGGGGNQGISEEGNRRKVVERKMIKTA